MMNATQVQMHLGSGKAPVPCPSARQDSRMVVSCQHAEKAKELEGKTVSPGYCMLLCKHYEGPQRTPALIQKVSGITVKGAPIRDRALVNGRTEPTPRPTLKQIKSWMAAEWSLLKQGPVPLPVFEERMAHCTACPHRIVDRADDPGYCDQCGCGSNDRARLVTKLHMPKAVCPTGLWLEAAGEGRNALKRLGGHSRQVRQQLKQALGSLPSFGLR